MDESSKTPYAGLDVHKDSIAVADGSHSGLRPHTKI